MFGAQFSRGRFSLPQQGSNNISIRLSVYNSLTGRFGAGADAKISSMALSARLTGAAGAAAALPAALPVRANLNCQAAGLEAIGIGAAPSLCLQNTAAAGANIGLLAELRAPFTGNMAAGADIYSSFGFNAGANCEAALGANLALGPFFTAILSSVADAALLEEKVVQIVAALPPGSELRIDSENYTVTLDGKNILHLQQGDWISIDRELASLVVDSGTASNLSGSVIYTEKYL